MEYSLYELLFCLILYAFLGWGVEVCYVAIKEHRFVNRGFLNLPLELPYGIAAVITLVVLPTLGHNLSLQYLVSGIICWLVWSLSDQFVRGISQKSMLEQRGLSNASLCKTLLVGAITALAYMVLYLMVHPVLFGLVLLLPSLFIKIFVIAVSVLILADFCSVVYTMRTNRALKRGEERMATTRHLGEQITALIWRRLQKSYPGIQEAEDLESAGYIFAKGICFDKLTWVFLVSSFLGAMIEMLYCYALGGTWMNRSSLLYGSFSVVWGFGAVILTVTLQRLSGKPDRAIFLAGFVIGGTYEYVCSVLTELVFGTVFWDYSQMPLNIGGRTNVLYCIFWGLLAVVWIKILYPPMEKGIEMLPPLFGKVITWILIVVLSCDGLLTAAAMVRYTDRQLDPQPTNIVEEFLDSRYDNAWMEHRWPNMYVTEE